MRIERKGQVAKLTPRLERFFVEALGGEALDSVQHAEARKADYKCLRGLLAIELKSLEEDASERMDHLTDELRERPDWLIFLGSAADSVFPQAHQRTRKSEAPTGGSHRSRHQEPYAQGQQATGRA